MKLKTKITELVNNFKQENAWDRSEEHIQTMFTVKLLDLLGFNSSNMRINQGQEVKTGKKPDILLFNNSGNTILVIESKDASKTEMLDGRYQNKTFVEQLIGYCNAEGIYWGILTNFVEWRIYSIYQDRLYKDRKYAFHDILWQNSNKNNYIDLLSEEGLMFFDRLSNNNLVSLKGRFDDDPVYYPQQD
ncbi:MAG TPA: type I restriction endonuclease, partial [Spirochaetota bacterium]|nr:type I restriction endonuclease [Spirochaetota bacterium]